MDHLLNNASPDGAAADEVARNNDTRSTGETFRAPVQTLPHLATKLTHSVVSPNSSAASMGLHMLSVSAAAPSMMMPVPGPPPRLPPISLLTAAATAQQPMRSRGLQTPAPISPLPPQHHQLCSVMTPLQAVRPSSTPSAPPQSSDRSQANDMLCRYRNKKCGFPRAIKRNGERHNLCERHRAKANQNQRKLESKRRVKKRMMQRVADRVVKTKKVIASPESEIKFTLYGSTVA